MRPSGRTGRKARYAQQPDKLQFERGVVSHAPLCMELSQVDSLASQHGLVAVQLGNQLPGSVHAQHGNAGVHGDDVAVCHVGSHGAAAALIDLAQSGNLPDDTGIVQSAAACGGAGKALQQIAGGGVRCSP